ncbi:hypothetical protein [Cedecea lapagei]|uniref:hypothetical protein n=1 Tax=Cedecea lapagei TaxID=158823 RepID=UPI001BCE1B2B|nr:hypothetical protein [Cedecea lapagei]
MNSKIISAIVVVLLIGAACLFGYMYEPAKPSPPPKVESITFNTQLTCTGVIRTKAGDKELIVINPSELERSGMSAHQLKYHIKEANAYITINRKAKDGVHNGYYSVPFADGTEQEGGKLQCTKL